MKNKQTENKSQQQAKPNSYLDYKVASRDSVERYQTKEIKVEKVVINFK